MGGGGGGATDIGGVLPVALGNFAAAGAGQTVNALTLILIYSDIMLLFPALLLPGDDEAGSNLLSEKGVG